MKKLTIKHQVLLLTVVMLFVQGVLAVIGNYSLTSINQKLDSVFAKRLPSINFLLQADRDFQQLLVAERTLLINGVEGEVRNKMIKDYLANKKQVLERFNKYQELAETSAEKELVAQFIKQYKDWEKESQKNFLFNSEGQYVFNEANRTQIVGKSLGQVSKNFEGARDQLDGLQELILGLGGEEFSQAQETYKLVNNLIVGISVGGILFSLLLGFFFSRSINNRISKIVDTMNAEGESLDNISTNLDGRSNEMRSISGDLSAATTETTASLHEITQMIKNNTDGANKVSQLVETSQSHIKNGVGFLENLTAHIQKVESSSMDLSQTIQKSNDELAEIIKVFNEVNNKTKVINDIVFQTKLLSFNASVEAARAGEEGKGFAVVAEEVGNLARMSGESADEISKLLEQSLSKVTNIVENSKNKISISITENQKYVKESVELGTKCKTAILNVSNDFNEVASTSSQVSVASQEQLTGVEEVNQAMQNISNAASMTNKSAMTVNGSSQDVRSAVSHISESIIDLRRLVENVKDSKKAPELNKAENKVVIEVEEDEDYSDVA